MRKTLLKILLVPVFIIGGWLLFSLVSVVFLGGMLTVPNFLTSLMYHEIEHYSTYYEDQRNEKIKADKNDVSGNDIYEYVQKGSTIFVKSDPGIFLPNTKYTPLEGADFESFRAVSYSPLVGKDKNTVYFGDESQPDIDSTNFESVGGYYYKNKNTVYFMERRYTGSALSPDFKSLDGADADSFVAVDSKGKGSSSSLLQARDKSSVWFAGHRVEGADPQSITFFGDTWSSDIKNVYLGTTTLAEIDATTFKYEGDGWVSDAKNVYFGVLYRGIEKISVQKIMDIDVHTYKIPERDDSNNRNAYVIDKNAVYFLTDKDVVIPVAGADPATFHLEHNGSCGVDATSRYCYGKRVSD